MTGVTFHPGHNDFLVSASLDGLLKGWFITEEIKEFDDVQGAFNRHEKSVLYAAFNHKGDKIVSGDVEKVIITDYVKES